MQPCIEMRSLSKQVKPGISLHHGVLQQILRVVTVTRQPPSMGVKRLPEWNDITFEPFVQRIGHVHAPLPAALPSNPGRQANPKPAARRDVSCRSSRTGAWLVSVCTFSDCLRGAPMSPGPAPVNTGSQQQSRIAASGKNSFITQTEAKSLP